MSETKTPSDSYGRLRSARRFLEPDSDWEQAAFAPPPADGYWVLEGIRIVGEETRAIGDTGKVDLFPVIGGTWRPATADDHDDVPE